MENQISRRIDSLLNSFSQVLLIENKQSGLLILLAVFIGSFKGAILALVGTVITNEFASLLNRDKEKIHAGLYGYCAVLIAIAGSLYFNNLGAFLLSVIGGLLSVPCMELIEKSLSRSKLPALTMPFILIVTAALLLGYVSPIFAHEQSGQLASLAPVEAAGQIQFIHAFLKGFGQIFLLDSILSSLLIAAAIFLDRSKNLLPVIGSIFLVTVLGILLGIDPTSLSAGLLTYNAMLSVLAVQEFVQGTAGQMWRITTVSILVTFIISCIFYPLLSTFGLTMLTWPFVIGTWGILFYWKLAPESNHSE